MTDRDQLASLEAKILGALRLAEQASESVCAAHLANALDCLRFAMANHTDQPDLDANRGAAGNSPQ